jgi:hypothetical protein
MVEGEPQPEQEIRINKYKVETIVGGYRIYTDTREEAVEIARRFWLENFPDMEPRLRSGMLNPAKHLIQSHAQETSVCELRGEPLVAINGNGQWLRISCEQWLVDNGYINHLKSRELNASDKFFLSR